MKKPLLLVLGALLALTSARTNADQVTINLGGAQLLTSGSTAVPNNMLVQLLANTSSSFDAPTGTSFTGGDPDEVVLWSGTISSTQSGVPGGFLDAITLTLGQLGAAEETGDYLMLRWYPTLSLSAAQPGVGTHYGQFDDFGLTTPDADSASDIDWQIPATQSNPYTLNYLSVSEGGDEPNSAGVASFTVVPEPGSISLIAGAFGIGLVALRRRRGR